MIKRFLSNKARNTYENIIISLKAELYDKEQEIKRLKAKNEKEKQIIATIRKLPTAKKQELGILWEWERNVLSIKIMMTRKNLKKKIIVFANIVVLNKRYQVSQINGFVEIVGIGYLEMIKQSLNLEWANN